MFWKVSEPLFAQEEEGHSLKEIESRMSAIVSRVPLRLQGFLHHHWTKQPTSLQSSVVLDPQYGTLERVCRGSDCNTIPCNKSA